MKVSGAQWLWTTFSWLRPQCKIALENQGLPPFRQMQDTTNWCKYIILEAGNNLDKLKPPKIVVSNDHYFTPGTYPHRTCYLIFVNTKKEKLGLFLAFFIFRTFCAPNVFWCTFLFLFCFESKYVAIYYIHTPLSQNQLELNNAT